MAIPESHQTFFILWFYLTMHLLDAQLASYRASGGKAVASGHDDLDAIRLQTLDGQLRGGFDGVGNSQQTREGAIDCQVHDARTVAA